MSQIVDYVKQLQFYTTTEWAVDWSTYASTTRWSTITQNTDGSLRHKAYDSSVTAFNTWYMTNYMKPRVPVGHRTRTIKLSIRLKYTGSTYDYKIVLVPSSSTKSGIMLALGVTNKIGISYDISDGSWKYDKVPGVTGFCSWYETSDALSAIDPTVPTTYDLVVSMSKSSVSTECWIVALYANGKLLYVSDPMKDEDFSFTSLVRICLVCANYASGNYADLYKIAFVEY